MFVYVVTMYRSNTLETHMYALGVFTKYNEALAAKVNEEDRMQDMYVGYVDEYVLDAHPPEHVAKKMYESSIDRTGYLMDVIVHQ